MVRVSVLGCMEAQFSVQGMPNEAKLLVSDDILEFMLGYDWLAQHGTKWEFATKTLHKRSDSATQDQEITGWCETSVRARKNEGSSIHGTKCTRQIDNTVFKNASCRLVIQRARLR